MRSDAEQRVAMLSHVSWSFRRSFTVSLGREVRSRSTNNPKAKGLGCSSKLLLFHVAATLLKIAPHPAKFHRCRTSRQPPACVDFKTSSQPQIRRRGCGQDPHTWPVDYGSSSIPQIYKDRHSGHFLFAVAGSQNQLAFLFTPCTLSAKVESSCPWSDIQRRDDKDLMTTVLAMGSGGA